MRRKAKWAIDSETIQAQGIILLKVTTIVGQKNVETKHLSLVKVRQNMIQLPKAGFQSWHFSLLVRYINI